jgi:hypothetical protein
MHESPVWWTSWLFGTWHTPTLVIHLVIDCCAHYTPTCQFLVMTVCDESYLIRASAQYVVIRSRRMAIWIAACCHLFCHYWKYCTMSVLVTMILHMFHKPPTSELTATFAKPNHEKIEPCCVLWDDVCDRSAVFRLIIWRCCTIILRDSSAHLLWVCMNFWWKIKWPLFISSHLHRLSAVWLSHLTRHFMLCPQMMPCDSV